ncbi:hypothetical protein ACWGS9_02145 [Bradyrhizobium sp. Arg314]
MITLNLWELLKTRTLDDREIAETLRDRDVEPAKSPAGEEQRKGASSPPSYTTQRDTTVPHVLNGSFAPIAVVVVGYQALDFHH